jgi:hypothetical protein
MNKRPSDVERLLKIQEALDESILEASEKDLREDFAQQGDDFDNAVARVGSTIERAKISAAKMIFERAKREMNLFREEADVNPLDLSKARLRLDGMRTGDVNDIMMAARKGGKLSERDENGVVSDLAQLEKIESKTREEGDE